VKIEQLVAAQLWLDELEAKLAQAAAIKWKILGDEFDGDDPPEGYEARASEVDVTGPIHEALARARVVLEERALAVVENRDAWPAGGSWVARACALAQAKAAEADEAILAAELLELRTRAGALV
jgi:hypothetical protein